MHIGLVIYGSLETVSGGYLYDRQLVRYLEARGDSVEVIALPWRSYGRHLFDNGSSQLQTILQYGGYDVLLQDELNHPSLFWLNATMRERPTPILSIVHHLRCSEARPAWQNRAYRHVEQRYLNSVDGFIYNSHTTRAAVAALTKRDMLGVVAYPGKDHRDPGITADAVALRAAADGPLRLLFVGNIIPRKGLDVVLQAVARLSPSTWSLDIVGNETMDRAYANTMARLIDRLPAGSRVTRHGRLEDDALAAHFAAAHVLVVPSTYEGYGIVYAEGLGYGLPAIATTSGGAGEIITDGLDGFLIEAGDVARLASVLNELQGDRDLLAALSARALERYQTLPTWAESAERIRGFLVDLIARYGKAI